MAVHRRARTRRPLAAKHFLSLGGGVLVALITLTSCATTGSTASAATATASPTTTSTPAATNTPLAPPTATPNLDPLAYVASLGNLYAVDQKNGAIVWRYNGVDANAQPLDTSTTIYTVTASKSGIVALAASSGQVLWSQPVANFVTRFTMQDGVIIVTMPQGVTALQSATGTVLWTQTPNWTVADATAADGRVFLTGSDKSASYLLAVDSAHGLRQWMLTVASVGLTGPLLVDNGSVFDQIGNAIYALREANGATEWSGDPGFTLFGIANGALFAGTECWYMGIIIAGAVGYCYNGIAESNGAQLWNYQYTDSFCPFLFIGCGPVTEPLWSVANGTISMLYDTLVASDQHETIWHQVLVNLSVTSGAVRWNYSFPERITYNNSATTPPPTPPLVDILVGDGATLYVETANGIISQFDPVHQRVVWSFTVPAGESHKVTIVADDLYVISTRSVLYALNVQTGATLWSVALT